MPVGRPPFDEEAALVLAQAVIVRVVGGPVRHAGAVAPLDLPPGHVGDDDDVAAGDQRRADPHDGHRTGLRGEPSAEGVEPSGVEELLHHEGRHVAEDAVVGEKARQHGFERRHVLPCRGGINHAELKVLGTERGHDLGLIDARVAVDHEDAGPACAEAADDLRPAAPGDPFGADGHHHDWLFFVARRIGHENL